MPLAMLIMSLKHLSMHTPAPRTPPVHFTGAPATNAAGTHLLPAAQTSCLVWLRCASGTAVSTRHTPLLLPFVVQHAGKGAAGPASPPAGAAAEHAFSCTPMGWQ